MALTANEQLLDALIRHQIYLLRYSGSVRNRIYEMLQRSETDIAEKIRGRMMKPGLTTPEGVKRMQALQSSVAAIRQKAWKDVISYFTEEMKSLAYEEPITFDKILQTTLPVQVSTVLPSAGLLKALVVDKPFEGRVMKEWAQSLAQGDVRRITNAIQLGMVEGEGMDKIARRITGTGKLFGRDGVTELTRNQIQSVARTAVMHVSNNARSAFLRGNSDIIDVEQFVATLDSRTSPVCRARDGQRFPLGSGPIPPLHYQCRSIRIAAFDSAQLGDRPANPTTEKQLVQEYAAENNLGEIKSREDLPRGTKGAYDAWSKKRIRQLVGPVPAADNTYQTWLTKQSKGFQDDVLGITKAKLFREGGLPLDKFVNRAGDELTLKELAGKHKDAFLAAGLDPARF